MGAISGWMRAAGAGAAVLAAIMGTAQSGPPPREANTTLLIDELPRAAFDPKTFEFLVLNPFVTVSHALVEMPTPDLRFVQVQRAGNVGVRFGDQIRLGAFLSISAMVNAEGELGLMDVAFAADYATTGVFYGMYHSASTPTFTRICRFTKADPLATGDGAAAEELLIQFETAGTVNPGGDLEFGPDGLLYATIGDGGGGASVGGARAQDTQNYHGKVLRIDVTGTPDEGLAYHIPASNPFVAPRTDGKTGLPEIYAWGFRNPKGLAFDPTSGNAIVCDLGESRADEVNFLTLGGNYGWPVMEGEECFPAGGYNCAFFEYQFPLLSLPHGGTGRKLGPGIYYTGSQHPELYGAYVYFDEAGAKLKALRFDGFQLVGPGLLADTPNGEGIVLLQRADGSLAMLEEGTGGKNEYNIVIPASGAPAPDTFPRRLSELPALLAAASGLGHEVPGVIYYRPSAQLWSDNARKERYVAMPGLGQIGFREENGWDFPEETVLIKNFALPLDDRHTTASAVRIETRVMLRKDGQWNGFSYEWNADQTDAILLNTGKDRAYQITNSDGDTVDYAWRYPSRTDCMTCHTQVANRVLGLNTAAMNFEIAHPGDGETQNQIERLEMQSVFASALPRPVAQLPRMPDYMDDTLPLVQRAKAYFDSNCAMCHQPGGPTGASMDMRWETPLGDMSLVDVRPIRFSIDPNSRLIKPGDVANSVVHLRMSSRISGQAMPPLGTSRPDSRATDFIAAWIEGLGVVDRTTWFAY